MQPPHLGGRVMKCSACGHLIHSVGCPAAAGMRRAGPTVLWSDPGPARRRRSRSRHRGFIDREIDYAVRRSLFDATRDLFR
jgi:hypothetical protein